MMLAHLTAVEGPVLWAVFALGVVTGVALARLVQALWRRFGS